MEELIALQGACASELWQWLGSPFCERDDGAGREQGDDRYGRVKGGASISRMRRDTEFSLVHFPQLAEDSSEEGGRHLALSGSVTAMHHCDGLDGIESDLFDDPCSFPRRKSTPPPGLLVAPSCTASFSLYPLYPINSCRGGGGWEVGSV